MDTDSFLNLCLFALGKMLDIANLLWGFWYFRLLFVAGLVWLVFDIFEEVSNIYNEHREEWR